MKVVLLVLMVVFILTASAPSAFLAEKEHIWERGKVISQQRGSDRAGAAAAPIGGMVVAVPLYRNWNIVVIEAEKYIYQWNEVGNKQIILPVNGEIQFYRDGDYFIVLDAKKNKHKFALVGMTLKH